MRSSHAHNSSSRVSAHRGGYDSDSKTYSNQKEVTRYRSKSVDDTLRNRSEYCGGKSYSGGGYKGSSYYDGGRYSGTGRYGGCTSNKYNGYSSSKHISGGSSGHAETGVGYSSKRISHDHNRSTGHIDAGSHGYSSSKYKSSSNRGHTDYRSSRTLVGNSSRDISDSKCGVEKTDSKCGVESNGNGSKAHYKIVGRVIRTPSPDKKGDRCDRRRYSTGLILPDLSRGSSKDKVCGTDGLVGRSSGSLPAHCVGRGGYGGSGGDLIVCSPRGGSNDIGRGGRDDHDYGSGGLDYDGKCRYDGYRGRSPYRRSYHSDRHYTGGTTRHSHGSPARRCRSMNDLTRSLSPGKRGATSDGAFPVCSRFPNCSVCIIDIPQNQPVSITDIKKLADQKTRISYKSTHC